MAILKDSERTIVQDLVNTVEKLPSHEQERLLWIGQGILFASKQNDKKQSD